MENSIIKKEKGLIGFKLKFPKKKYLEPDANKEDILPLPQIFTNLSELKLNKNAMKGIYLYGCDIEEENHISREFIPVNIMRNARKLKCFQEYIKQIIEDYYISGLILIGKPKEKEKEIEFEFFLKIGENTEIIEELPENIESEKDEIYKFKFKRKEKDLSKMKEGKTGEFQYVVNYLNICLGKILKKCGYTKDRSTKKIFYYHDEKKWNQKCSNLLFFPGLKAVCETYDQGKIYMKLLPKTLIKSTHTYADYFYSLANYTLEEAIEIFKNKVIERRGIKVYDQTIIKIDDIVYDSPYNITFIDKKKEEWTVGDYYTNHLKIPLEDEAMPIAVRVIDKGGKLKGSDRLFIHIPCKFLGRYRKCIR